MNINEIINQKVAEVIASEKLAAYVNEQVEKHVNGIVKDALDNVFGYSGEGYKQIKEIIKSKIVLPTVGDISLPAYNTIVAEMIQRKLTGIMNDTLIEKVNDEIEKFITPQGKIYKFSELIKNFKDEAADNLDKDDLDFDDGYAHAECTIDVEKSNYGGYWISIDAEEDKSKYSCKYRIGINIHDNKSRIFSLTINDVDYKKSMIIGDLSTFEALLVNLYLSKTEIELDIDPEVVDNEIEINEHE
jgi:hypothetical protein